MWKYPCDSPFSNPEDSPASSRNYGSRSQRTGYDEVYTAGKNSPENGHWNQGREYFSMSFFLVPFRDHWMKNPGAAWKDQAWLALRTGNFSENYWTNCWWHLITWFESQSYGNPYDSDQDVGVYTVDDVPSIGATELTEEEAAAIASYESYFLTERGTVSIFVIRCS